MPILAVELPVVCYGKSMNDNYLAPMRPILEGLGCSIQWDNDTQTIIASDGSIEVKLTVGSNVAYVNGVEKQLPVAPCVDKGNTYIPIRFISDAFKKELRWLQNIACSVIELNPNDGYISSITGERNRTSSEYILIAPEIKGKISQPMLEDYQYNSRLFWDDKYQKNLSIEHNSVDGVTLIWDARNNTGKEIKYFTLNIRMLNRVGDPAYCEITGRSKLSLRFIGGIKSGESLGVYNLIAYSGACDKVIIDSIKLEYSDGTMETVKYGYTATPYIIE